MYNILRLNREEIDLNRQITRNEIESVSVGYKEDFNMYSMDFEEYLWARGYSEGQINDLYYKMIMKGKNLMNFTASLFKSL